MIMIKNIFKYFSREKREQRKKLKELQSLSSVFTTVSKLETSGLLIWSEKDRSLFISQSLATLMLAKGAEAWTCFVQNVHLYHYYQQCQSAWQQYIQQQELAAVRKASLGAHPPLTRSDADRIRTAARQRILESDVEPPKVQPFQFFIMRESEQPKPDLIAVGYFDPETGDQEIAPWAEVSELVRADAK
jgi:hypothetical protein